MGRVLPWSGWTAVEEPLVCREKDAGAEEVYVRMVLSLSPWGMRHLSREEAAT